jgi:arylformamidase
MELHDTNWIDVTTIIQNGMVHWPTDMPVEIRKSSSIKEGDKADVTFLKMSAHTGTHVDAQKHFISGGKDSAQISFNKLIGPVKVFSIKHPHRITLNELKSLPIGMEDRILFKTKNSDKDWTLMPFLNNYISLDADAAHYLADKNVWCIGVDYLSVASKDNASEVHCILLEKEILIIEGLFLHDVEQGAYEMICLPLKIKDADGAPARVLLKPLIKK